MKKYILILLSVVIFQACSHVNGLSQNRLPKTKLSLSQKNTLYLNIAKELKETHAIHLKECNCMKAFYRDLFAAPNDTARYIFDKKVSEHAILKSAQKNTVDILAIGSGMLLNELTALANLIAQGKNLNIYLSDWAYVFYGDEDFKEKALKFGNNPENLPEGWQSFYFWAWAKNEVQPYLPFFEKHHQAIDEFKTIIRHLDQAYGTQSSITIIKPAKDHAINLPSLDLVISIDAFIDLPNLMWNLFYQMKLSTDSVRFIALNKTRPFVGSWESPDLSMREANSMRPVSIEIYDVTSKDGMGSYKLIEKTVIEATEEQIKKAPEFITNPELDSTQSPLDLSKDKR